MKLLIHIKFTSGESAEYETESTLFVITLQSAYICEGTAFKLSDIKELIIKPLP